MLAVGDRVILGGVRGGRPVALSLPLTLSGRARSLGRADTFLPSLTSERLWAARWSRLGTKTASVSLREVDLGGHATTRITGVVPRWSGLLAVADDGFLVSQGSGLTLRRRPSGQARLRFRHGWLMAAERARFAWCRGRCGRVRIWSRQGARTLEPPGRLRPDPMRGSRAKAQGARRRGPYSACYAVPHPWTSPFASSATTPHA